MNTKTQSQVLNHQKLECKRYIRKVLESVAPLATKFYLLLRKAD